MHLFIYSRITPLDFDLDKFIRLDYFHPRMELCNDRGVLEYFVEIYRTMIAIQDRKIDGDFSGPTIVLLSTSIHQLDPHFSPSIRFKNIVNYAAFLH